MRWFDRSASEPARRKEIAAEVDPAFGFRRIALELSVPSLPADIAGAGFAEHAFDTVAQASTDTVVLGGTGCIAVSSDLGRRWRRIAIPEIGKARLRNSFTLSNGNRLLQEGPPADIAGWPGPKLFLTDGSSGVIQAAQVGQSPWHGPRSIDERGGTVMFAEYPNNAAKYRKDFEERRAELEPLCKDCRVFRSRDHGRSWQVVFQVPWQEIRHFHTLIADPFESGMWWLSSGDTPAECRVWCSRDDGDTWQDATDPSPQVELHPKAGAYRMSVHRYTDAIILPDRLIWGTDDVLGAKKLLAEIGEGTGARVGSRLVSASKTLPLKVRSGAYIGNQVRSIVDVGAAYLLLTEAKEPAVVPGPQLFMMSKRDPELIAPLGMVDGARPADTGFTYSMSSKAAKDGCFFSMRKSTDVFDGGPQLLAWRATFE